MGDYQQLIRPATAFWRLPDGLTMAEKIIFYRNWKRQVDEVLPMSLREKYVSIRVFNPGPIFSIPKFDRPTIYAIHVFLPTVVHTYIGLHTYIKLY